MIVLAYIPPVRFFHTHAAVTIKTPGQDPENGKRNIPEKDRLSVKKSANTLRPTPRKHAPKHTVR
jgi:hypothetical protein